MMYLVYKFTWDDVYPIFVTSDSEKAIKYYEKANRLLEKWQDYFRDMDNKRSTQIRHLAGFGYKEIEVR